MSRRDPNSPALAAVEVHGMTRSSFLLRGALAAGSMYGAGAVAPWVSGALAQTKASDIEVLKFALGLEQLEAAFYAAALKFANLAGDVKEIATEFGKQEQEHVDVLREAITMLGGKPGPAPKAKFGVTDQKAFLELAAKLEDTGVGAYNGALPKLTTPDLILALGGIVQVEGRHAAAVRLKAGQDPAPRAFDAGLSPAQVQGAIRQATGG
jgi:rubrerythrin